jgi:GH25 family lysozyme M1 (1,4-beta-N-acetylmuramidase)
MTNILAIDDWAGNIITDYKPMIDGGVKVSINRLGQGDSYNNTGEKDGKGDWLYKQHIEEASKNGLLNETYWVINPSIGWEKQLDWIVANWQQQYDDLPFAVDVELTDGLKYSRLIDSIENLLVNFEMYYHEQCLIYTGKYWFWETFMRDKYGRLPIWQTEYDFWLARYLFKTYPRISCSWKELESYYPNSWVQSIDVPRDGMEMRPVPIYQWTGDKFLLPGIEGPIDLNFVKSDWLETHLRHSPISDPTPIPLPIFKPYSVTVTALWGLNIRMGAGTNYNKVGVLFYEDIVTILEESNNWGRIDSSKGNGWICLDYVSKI